MHVKNIDNVCISICLQIFHDLFLLWVAIFVNYLTRDKVCNGECFGSISFVIFSISLNNTYFSLILLHTLPDSDSISRFNLFSKTASFID